MDNIDQQYDELQEKIPKYNHLKHVMTENSKYDFKGDELLHFRTHAQPDIRKKKIIDNNELFVNSQFNIYFRHSYNGNSYCIFDYVSERLIVIK